MSVTALDVPVRRPIELGATLRRLREDQGLTQEQLAQAMGVSRRWVGTLEAGRNPGVQFSLVTAAARALGAELHIVTTVPESPAEASHV
ncbi:MAG: helix-turn-helix domain-containing protein [Propionibacteriaceae bacterium]|jgi:transcriptional regulator with XRE-family HTH domain|nr:helix-turn-helix domain-containing protein [Propionibacteriaceae bacterium]